MISVIIPIYNEEEMLRKNEDYFRQVSSCSELIFIDGGSDDQSNELASNFGQVIASDKSRAIQMNTGVNQAKGEILLFLHADTKISVNLFVKIEESIKNGWIGGCFTQVIDHPEMIYKWIAFTGNIRAKISKVFYGDQGIFVRKDIFLQLGGYPKVSIAEDVDFSRMMRKHGTTGILPDPIFCSARRWLIQGVLKTYWINLKINFGLSFDKESRNFSKIYQDVR